MRVSLSASKEVSWLLFFKMVWLSTLIPLSQSRLIPLFLWFIFPHPKCLWPCICQCVFLLKYPNPLPSWYNILVLDCPKSSFRFFCNILQNTCTTTLGSGFIHTTPTTTTVLFFQLTHRQPDPKCHFSVHVLNHFGSTSFRWDSTGNYLHDEIFHVESLLWNPLGTISMRE